MRIGLTLVAATLSCAGAGCYCSHEAEPEPDASAPDAGVRVGRRDDSGLELIDGGIDASCPDAGPPPGTVAECDPVMGGCPDGEACYLDVIYPDTACGQEVFAARCAPAGHAGDEEPCGATRECSEGMACFVTGAATRCLLLCALDGGEPRCPRGRICAWADLPDFGACL